MLLVYLLPLFHHANGVSYRSITYAGPPQGGTSSQSYRNQYLSFSGSSGLQLPITTPSVTSPFDYTISFGFNLKPLKNTTDQTLFDIRSGLTCSVTSALVMVCNTGQKIELSQLPDNRSWMQLTYIADSKQQSSLLRVDLESYFLTSNGSFLAINTTDVFLGIGRAVRPGTGFQGLLKEFYMNAGKLDQSAIPALTYNVKVFELSAMAYYQFNPNTGVLNDGFRFQQAKIVGATGLAALTFVFDENQRKICDSLDMNFYQNLPSINNAFESPKVKIPGFKLIQTQYSYTMSIWIKSSGSHGFTSDAKNWEIFNFINLENIFALWFDSPTSFRVYVFASKDFNSEQSNSIQIPIRQWTNIQLVMDQKFGLTVAVYNQNGQRISSYFFGSNSLPEQVPTGNIQLLNNFIGEVKQITLWQARFDLPLSQNETSGLVFDLNFMQDYFDGKQWSTKSADSFTYPGKQGYTFYQTKVPNPASIDFKNPSKLGTFNSTLTMWDGFGCTPIPKSLVLISQPLQSQFLVQASNQLTVEFWFRFKNATINQTGQITLLNLQVIGLDTSVDSLTIFIDNGVLKCAPFGIKQINETLVYNDVFPLNETRWQHVSCGFEQRNKVLGQYLAYSIPNTGNIKQLLPQTFGLQLSQSTKRSPNFQMDRQYFSQVGSSLQAIYFKDVRIWNEMRSVENLYQWRFRQLSVKTNSNLMLNYKLLDGNLTIKNEVQTSAQVTSAALTMETTDANHIICANDRYYEPFNSTCVSTPFTEFPLIYTAQSTLQNGLQIQLTNKYRQSGLMLPSMQPECTQMWSIDDSAVGGAAVSPQKFETDLVLNPYTLGDGYKYTFKQVQQSSEVNYFWSKTSQVFYPRKCLYLVDTTTSKPFNQITYFRQKDAGQQQCFKMVIKSVDGCFGTYFDILRQEVTVDSSPSVPLIQNQTTFTVSQSDKTIQACIPGPVLQLVRGNEPINLAFSVYWGSTQSTNNTEWSYINAVYQLIIIDKINVTLTASSYFVDLDDTVTLDASNSTFSFNASQKGLYFRWSCNQIFQQLCDQFEGSPALGISSNAFKSYGGVALTNYTFTVQVWSLQSGSSPLNQAQIFQKSITLQWDTFASPVFDIVVPLLVGQTVPRIVSSQDVTVTVNLKNYRSSDSRLNYTWTLSPASKFNSKFQDTSVDQSVFGLKVGALQPNTTYSLKVTIANVNSNQSQGVNYLNFTTGTPPKAGTLTVLPNTGTMFYTTFAVVLKGWISNVGGNLLLNVWGVTQLQPLSLVQVGPSLQAMNSTGLTVSPGALPLIVSIQVDVYDLIGEKTTMSTPVTVNRPSTQTSWSSSTVYIIQTYPGQPLYQQKYLYFAFVCQNCANDVSKNNGIDPRDCMNAEQLMLNQAIIDIKSVSPNDDSLISSQLLTAVSGMIQQATANPSLLNSTILTSALTILQNIPGKILPFQSAVADQNFQLAYLQSIGNLIKYQSSQLTPTTKSRRLQQSPQSVINALIVQKNILLDALCKFDISTQVQASNIYLSTQQLSITDQQGIDIQILNKLDSSIVILPLDELLQASADYDTQATSVCLQVTFMTNSPVPTYTFDKQQVLNATFLQITSLDDRQNRLLTSVGLKDLKLNPYKIQFAFDKQDPQFINNQTVCMSYNANSNTPSPWSANGCITSYSSSSDQQIVCQCEQLNNFYYGLVNDFTRVAIVEQVPQYQLTWPFLIILLGLFVGMTLPCAAMYFDKRDHINFKDFEWDLHLEELTNNLQKKRNLPFEEEMFYKFKDITTIYKWNEFDFFKALWLISGNFHPLVSLKQKFDYKVPRLNRAVEILLQVAVITLLTIGIYYDGRVLNADPAAPVFITLILGVLSLPIPQFFYRCCMYKFEVIKQDPKKVEKEEVPTEGKKEEVAIEGKCLLCKVLFALISVSLYLISIIITGFFVNGVIFTEQASFRMSIQNAQNVLVVWACTLIWGYIYLNGFRIIFITFIAYRKANQIYRTQLDTAEDKVEALQSLSKNGNENKKNVISGNNVKQTEKPVETQSPANKTTPVRRQCSCFALMIPQEAVDLCLDALWIIKLKELKTAVGSQLHVTNADNSRDQFLETKMEPVLHYQNKKIAQSKISASDISLELSNEVNTEISQRSNTSKMPQPLVKKGIQRDQDEDSEEVSSEVGLKDEDKISAHAKLENNQPQIHHMRTIGQSSQRKQVEDQVEEIIEKEKKEKKEKKDKKHKKHKKHKKDKKELKDSDE